jgi:type I restriction enzyme S subunit
MALVRVDERRLHPRFFLYQYLSPHFQELLRSRTIPGSTVDRILLTEFPDFNVDLPPLPEQRAIAGILGALDDKIELNREMNRMLEALARALFRSWFVDFDPVTAKAEGRAPFGMDAATAALFPDRFAESELGPIPEGWRLGHLAETACVNSRLVRSGYPHDWIEYVDIASVTCGQLRETQRLPLAEAPSRAQRLVAHGDTIWSCVRPNRKSFLLIQEPAPNLVVSTGFAVLSPLLGASAFLYLWVTAEEFVDYLTALAEGSAYPAVRPEAFTAARILIPPSSVLAVFEQQVEPLLASRAQNERESRTLAELRDLLLPKLLSGEIRIKQAEKVMVEAAC